MTSSAPESSSAPGPGTGQRLRAADVLLADRGQLFRALFLSAPIGKAVVDPSGRMLLVNPALCELTGRTSGELTGRHLDLLTHPDDVPLEDRATEHVPGAPLLDPQLAVVGERRLRRADGESVWVHQTQELVHHANGALQFVLLSMVDVTDRRRAEEDLVRRAFTDPLTGLPNRRALTDRLGRALAFSRRRGTSVGLLHLDLDRFTAVNDSLGHEGGDQLLCQVADRLRWSTRVEDTAVRFGADEFLVLAEEVDDVDGLRTIADRLLSVLDEPFHVNDREITLSASVGVTLGTDVAPEALLRQAHSALARAKANGGRGRVEVHDEALGEGYVDQLQLETDLRHALEAGELRLFYQPIVALSDEHLLGYEALIRWQHPTRGLLPPGAFLAAAEDNRLTSRLGAWVLHQACWDAAGWDPALRVHVNISARHLAEPGFSELVADALATSGLAPERLELEITESTALFAADATLHAVDQVTESGVTLALDDFGTGYSAITALHRLPIHTVKIDRSFVADVVTQPATAALVQGLLQLGQGMGLQVIAEGIEDGEQARWLREHGCAMAQGYAFGRPAPLPARELDDLAVPPDLVGLDDPSVVPDDDADGAADGDDGYGPLDPAADAGGVELVDGVEDGTDAGLPLPGDDAWDAAPAVDGERPDADAQPAPPAVPQLDSFAVFATDPRDFAEPEDLPETPEQPTAQAADEPTSGPIAEPIPLFGRWATEDPGTPAEPVAQPEPAAGPGAAADPAFDPHSFAPSSALAELSALLAASGRPDALRLPEPRDSADHGEYAGRGPRSGPFPRPFGGPATGPVPRDLPEPGDRR
ncbi:putative bifunctional diguanylate cyclase/phosphodiesterase [Modestobacter roseus]|uniref:PAS domain S-box-containing protein/diguanylate cyclase (GGDEF)-like protein n=1 Tax=Modestobacter roseus TaxID=1181884 RepID=A0A562IM33_9ACTN|nr:EAL domain-containing protein [Modestobacter roseus]MQA33805.1 EAL domain-containing protein [Modestobacter roseus]TWH72010.1 PAS domain S-box-containing protein/diguanylate cyclase (GGDEF)-like protein [Modestobacter roseus]